MTKIYIVAEIGVNWLGDVDLCKQMIDDCKEAGCDAVKFQAFLPRHVNNNTELLKSSITEDKAVWIKKYCEGKIDFGCTPMYVQAVSWMKKHVKFLKVRAFDMAPLLKLEGSPILEECLETGLPVYASVPTMGEYLHNKYRDYEQINQLKYLQCVSKYPTDIKEIDFYAWEDDTMITGFSCHCPDPLAPIIAAIKGATVIELHVMPDREEWEDDPLCIGLANPDGTMMPNRPPYPDEGVSFDMETLKSLVTDLRKIEQIHLTTPL